MKAFESSGSIEEGGHTGYWLLMLRIYNFFVSSTTWRNEWWLETIALQWSLFNNYDFVTLKKILLPSGYSATECPNTVCQLSPVTVCGDYHLMVQQEVPLNPLWDLHDPYKCCTEQKKIITHFTQNAASRNSWLWGWVCGLERKTTKVTGGEHWGKSVYLK